MSFLSLWSTTSRSVCKIYIMIRNFRVLSRYLQKNSKATGSSCKKYARKSQMEVAFRYSGDLFVSSLLSARSSQKEANSLRSICRQQCVCNSCTCKPSNEKSCAVTLSDYIVSVSSSKNQTKVSKNIACACVDCCVSTGICQHEQDRH